MKKISEEKCIFCDDTIMSPYSLYEDNEFQIICDSNPLTEGHILLTPKRHITTMGALTDEDFKKYKHLYQKIKKFVESEYGEISIFEHGIVGQTIFHAHTHFIPFSHKTEEIIPRTNCLREIASLEDIQKEFSRKKEYLFFENKNQLYLVDTKLGFPRFFRDIYAELLKAGDRADWKKIKDNPKLFQAVQNDIEALKRKWKNFHK